MMKKFFTVAFVALALSASTAFAQTATEGQAEPQQKEMRVKGDKKDKKEKKDKKDRKDKKGHKGQKDCKERKECRGQNGFKGCAADSACQGGQCTLRQFEGLNLTEEQQTQLQALQQQTLEARKAKMEAAKEQKKEAKDAIVAERKAAKLDYLSKVKGILTPAQYVDFLENYYVNSQQGPKGMKPGKGMKGEKGQKPGKGHKGGKGQRPATVQAPQNAE